VLATRWADERGWAVVKPAFFGGFPPVLRDVVAGAIRRRTLGMLRGRDFLRRNLEVCVERLQRVLDHLEARAPESGFWLGAKPSVADLGLFGSCTRCACPRRRFGPRTSPVVRACRCGSTAWTKPPARELEPMSS
jgi:glutathione S-transferase